MKNSTTKSTGSTHIKKTTRSTRSTRSKELPGYTGRKRAILTKVNDETYMKLKGLQEKLGYNSIYSLVEGLIYLELRCIRDYPSFHGGKVPEKFSDIEDMLDMYSKYRIPLELE